MGWQSTPYTWPLLAAALATGALAAFAVHRRRVPGAPLFALVAGLLTMWSATYALELASTTLDAQMAWLHARYVGVMLMPPAWLLFCSQYTGHASWLRRGVVAPLLVVTAVLWAVMLTNPFHGLFWTGVRLSTLNGLLKWTADMGPAYWMNVAWAYGLFALGSVLVVDGVVRSPRVHRGQAVCLLVAAGVPWAANVLYQLGWQPMGFFDPTPPAFTVSVLVMGWALFRYGFLQLVPIARHAVFDGMGDAVLVLDPAGRIVDMNPAARRLAGGDAVGQRAAEVLGTWPLPAPDGRRPELARTVDGDPRVFEVRTSAIARGSTRGELVVLADVTDRRQAEDALARNNQRLEALYERERRLSASLQTLSEMKTSFMIVTSHEMRTPLTVLRGYHELLDEALLTGDAASQAVRVCRRTIERMVTSLEDILEMLRLDEKRVRLQRRATDLAELAREVADDLQPFLERRKQRVFVEPASGLTASVDPRRVRLVLQNLLENAVKFTPDGGAIRVSMDRADGAAHVVVQDEGVGIDPAELERIFESFYTGRDALHHSSGQFEFEARGAGLGLSIVRAHVEAHGGRTWAESPGPGHGSRFHVVLPAGD